MDRLGRKFTTSFFLPDVGGRDVRPVHQRHLRRNPRSRIVTMFAYQAAHRNSAFRPIVSTAIRATGYSLCVQ